MNLGARSWKVVKPWLNYATFLGDIMFSYIYADSGGLNIFIARLKSEDINQAALDHIHSMVIEEEIDLKRNLPSSQELIKVKEAITGSNSNLQEAIKRWAYYTRVIRQYVPSCHKVEKIEFVD